MSQNPVSLNLQRRTAADELFEQIRNDINKMQLVPGTKLSEAEIARQYDVSRQPVREAFIRLDNLSLLKIRPQKATIVRPISRSAIRQARFVRAAVEIEVARKACLQKNSNGIDELQRQLDRQSSCLDNNDIAGFNSLDREFHQCICRIADCEFAIQVINDCKAKVDRLCILSLASDTGATQVYNDHVTIAKHLVAKNEEKLIQSIRDHLARLDSTCLLYTSPSPRDRTRSRMPSSA